jgi:uroporphyrinogen-III synthase
MAGERPLTGLGVLVTRAEDQAEPLVRALQAAGAEPIVAPMIRIVPAADSERLDAALLRIPRGEFDWVVFTSGNAVDHVLDRLVALGLDGRVFAGVRVAAVGGATGATLERAGVSLALVPDRFDAEALLEALVARRVAGQRILLPQGNLARDVLSAGLAGAGALVDVVEAYRTVPADAIDPGIRSKLVAGTVDVLTFASPSSVHTLAALLGDDLSTLTGSAVACVGPVTALAARDAGLRVDVVAGDATIPGLVAALVAGRQRIEATRAARIVDSDAAAARKRSERR